MVRRPPTPASPSGPGERSTGFLLIYALANAGGAISYLPLLTLLLPAKIERIAGDARIDLLTAVAVIGAVAASSANIAFGWFSDRTLAAAGGAGRRAWMAGGVLATALAYAGLIAAQAPGPLVVAVVAFQVAINAVLAPLAAIMADEVPDGQKGVAGGLLALAGPGAFVLSAVLVDLPGWSEAGRLAMLPLAVAGLTAPLLLTRARPVAAVVPVGMAEPSRRDLAVAWAARLLVQVAGVVLSLYILYYFESIAPTAPRAALTGRVGRLLAGASVAALPAAVLLGRLSDRIGRRKPVLLGSAAVAALGLVAMAVTTDRLAAALGFGLYTAGAAVFLALHAGFAMQLLPDPRRRGRDLGLVNLTNTLPSIVGPPLAWLLATPRDFSGLLLALAALTAAGGAAMTLVRGRR